MAYRSKFGGRREPEELDDEQLEPEVTMEPGYAKVVVVDNIPITPGEKYDKLKGVISKIFSAMGPIRELYMPQDEAGNTKGFSFIEFVTTEAAEVAVSKLNGYKLDKSHIFNVQMYDDFKKLLEVPDVYQQPELKPYEPKEDLRSWLLEKRVIDQYAIRYSNVTEVLWNNLKAGEENESAVQRKEWSETYIQWSPQGSYLLTVHSKGIALWGGASWNKIVRFPHNGVKLVDFSPCENYLVTASPQYQDNDNPKDPQCIIVWDVRSGKKLRGFLSGGHTGSWPLFKWSHDDKFLARIGEDSISVYEAPSMDLLDKKSIKVNGVKDFSWSPSANIISYFIPEGNNQPAAVVLMDIPSRNIRRQKNLFNVQDCKLHWQSAGEFLAAKVDKLKGKKTTFTSFEVFRVKEKDIPIEMIELKEGNVQAFAWEPKGQKFAVIHGEGARPDISFFSMERGLKLVKTLEKKAANALFWAPCGDFIVLAGLNSLNGALEFFNAAEMETMGHEDHYNASQVEWDPTGRYVATIVSFWTHQVETGYNLYSFQGKLMKHVLKEKFYQLIWRPRPPSLLTAEKLQYIKKNIHKYFKEFKDADNLEKQKAEEERFRKKEDMRAEFENFMQQKKKEYEADRAIRRNLRGGEDSDDEDDYYYKEEWVEEVEDRQEILVD
eukprot:TRINITY_DN813_c0_g1_i1.p1 TRINITY_DN813_c0_g1~~TRINITY_DN813_c0_g1_i1.p1  ORF type:complete len:699 (-),score=236.33 TRINITY_DN813_c0_g1_i1:74-2059(-)